MNFYQFTPETLNILLSANLTAAEWRMWAYFACHDPWGNNYVDTPETLAIMEKCNLKKSTYYKTIARLQELELYDFQDKGFQIRNLRGNSTIIKKRTELSEISENIPESRKTQFQENGKHSEISENVPEFRKPVQEFGTHSKISENQAPKPLPRKHPEVSKISLDLNKKDQIKKDSLSLENKAISKPTPAIEREKLSLFEEWKKTAVPGEPEDFEEFVRTERRKVGALDIMHFPSFMGDKYFPEWLKKWQARKTRNYGSKAAHYQNWTEAQHREIAKEYVIDPVSWMSKESWRIRWVEFVAEKYPLLFTEVLKEFDPPSSPAPPAPQKLSSTASPPPSQPSQPSQPSPPSPPPTSRLKGKLPDIMSKPEVEQLVCPSRFRKRQVKGG